MRNLAAALAASVCAVAMASPAQAQTQEFRIPAGALKAALDGFVKQSGRQLIYRTDEVRGVVSPGAAGSMSADAALDRILAGTGFTARRDRSGALAIVRADGNALSRTSADARQISSSPSAQGTAIGEDGALQAPTAEVSTQEEDREIVVTGSRIARSTFNTPNPVTVIDEKDAERLNLSNVNDMVSLLPQNSVNITPATVGGSFNSGVQFVNLRGLNPFFGTRTLTLMNGQRVVPTTAGAGVDTTLIPSMLVARVETETAGGSAVYGTDAIAGVANIILNTSFEGIKGQADFSQTKYGDGRNYHASAAYGTGFAEDRGHFIIGGEFEQADGIYNCTEARDWCADNYSLFNNVDYNTPGAPGYGQPRFIIGPNGTVANSSLTGVLIPVRPFAGTLWIAPIGGMQFNDSGSALVPFTPGAYAPGAGAFSFQQGGDPNAPGAYQGRTIRPEVRKYTALARLDYDLSDTVTASLDGWFARTVSVNPAATGASGPAPTQFSDFPNNLYLLNYVVTSYNAFLTPDQQAYVNSLGTGRALFGRSLVEDFKARSRATSETWRVSAALQGEFGGSWGWDVYAQLGQTTSHQAVEGVAITPFLGLALDAVRNDAGQIVCGVTIPGQINPVTGLPYTAASIAFGSQNGGCQPLNLFGSGNASQAALDYVYSTIKEDTTLRQAVVSGFVRGDLFGGWGAGSIKFAAGAEYRHDLTEVTHDLENQPWYKQYALGFGLDFKGTIDVVEGYAELNVPVLKDVPFFEYLEINGAVRQTYNKAHNKTTLPPGFASDLPAQAGQSKSRDFRTWKISGIWDVTDWLRFRATRSRDVRAPQFRELFQTYARGSGLFSQVRNPWQGGIPQETNIASGGSLNVREETGDTLTAGVVLQPKGGFLDGFRVSADWFQIKINDPIIGPPVGIGAQNIVDGCFAGSEFFCSLVTRDDANNILAVDNGSANLGRFTTRGLDFEAAYNLPLNGGEAGELNIRALASYVYDMRDPVRDYAGQTGPFAAISFMPSPYWRANAFVTYSKGPFSGTVQLRYIGAGRFITLTGGGGAPVTPDDPGYATTNPNSLNDNTVPAAMYVNLAASYEITDNVTLFGNINNLFNKEPPPAPTGGPTNAVYFDVYGMTWKAGVRARF